MAALLVVVAAVVEHLPPTARAHDQAAYGIAADELLTGGRELA
ncbi:MAG TPA: hypothetical protein VNT24_01230 [Propionibacteriaceae bacterium]|nr:hypothetical protein [Propionibacteriaceae bacterium]